MRELLLKSREDRIIEELKNSNEGTKERFKMIRAGIPKEFWHISLDNFDGDPKAFRIIEKYCKHLDKARKKGIGFLFMGANGVGKTSLMMVILKEALKRKYKAFYISLPGIFRQIYTGFKYPEALVELKKRLYDTDFLAIGELGKDYHRQGSELFMISEFDSIFRERRGAVKPIIMDTNLDENDLKDSYGESLISLFKSNLKFVTMKGRDYRKVKQEQDVNRFFGND